jgi:hypothetical protein
LTELYNTLIIQVNGVSQIYGYIDTLKKDGLVHKIDFDFAYFPPYYDSARLEITFHNAKYTIFYKLKWN